MRSQAIDIIGEQRFFHDYAKEWDLVKKGGWVKGMRLFWGEGMGNLVKDGRDCIKVRSARTKDRCSHSVEIPLGSSEVATEATLRDQQSLSLVKPLRNVFDCESATLN